MVQLSFDQLVAKLNELEGRIASLELRSGKTPSSVSKPKTEGEVPTSDTARTVASTAPSAVASISAPKSAPSRGGILGLVGVAFFILSAAFFIKLAIVSGWLNPERQVIGAFLFGLGLMGSGLALNRKDAPYASFLCGGGLVVLYLAIYGGNLYYRLYSENTAAIYVAIVTLAALFLFNSLRYEFFLIVSIVGTYLVPVLLQSGGADLYLHIPYFVVWDLFFCGCAILLGWRNAISFAAYAALGVFQYLYATATSQSEVTAGTVWVQFAQFAIFSCATAFYSFSTKQRLSLAEAWSYLLVMLFFYAAEYNLISQQYPGAAPWVAVVFSALLFGLYWLASTRAGEGKDEFSPVLWLFLAVVFFHAVYVHLLIEPLRPWLGLGLILILGIRTTAEKTEQFIFAKFVLWGIVAVEYLKALGVNTVAEREWEPSILFAALFAAVILAAYGRKSSSSLAPALLLLGSAQAGAALFRIAHQIFAGATANYATSAFWAAFALAIMLWGVSSKRSELSRAATAIFCVVALKVLLYDIASSSSLVRVIALMVVGAIIYLGGLVRRREEAT